MRHNHIPNPWSLDSDVCWKCEIESAIAYERKQAWKRVEWAKHGHDLDDPNDEWNFL